MRVPNYYCPHCGRFKKQFQVEWWEYSMSFSCRHCGNRIMETEELFLNIVKEICAKRGRKESGDAEEVH